MITINWKIIRVFSRMFLNSCMNATSLQPSLSVSLTLPLSLPIPYFHVIRSLFFCRIYNFLYQPHKSQVIINERRALHVKHIKSLDWPCYTRRHPLRDRQPVRAVHNAFWTITRSRGRVGVEATVSELRLEQHPVLFTYIFCMLTRWQLPSSMVQSAGIHHSMQTHA